jgi:hypothetical protein
MTHKPGRGHRRKSDAQTKKRFRKKAARRKSRAEQEHEKAIERWQAMSSDARQMRPELDPDNFKP